MDKKNPLLMKSKLRVQKHGEVFTPQWVVDKMIAIPGIKEKTEDVFATFLEPSAGEGAFLLTIEDMKLRHVTENYSEDTWNCYALWALSSIYGIEFLEDNLSVARQNMLELFWDYCESVHGTPLSKQSNLYNSAQTIIWANVVQGDTLTHKNNSNEEIVFSLWNRIDGFPGQVRRISFLYSSLFGDDDISKSGVQLSLFDEMNAHGKPENNWQECYAIIDIELVWKEEKDMSDRKPGRFKFDVVIGNPPYQEEARGTSASDDPIYNIFMEEAYKIAERVSFITPARFLFNAGKTPSAWNKKMLEDEHLKIEYFEQDSSKVFGNTNINGGVVVTYRDASQRFGPIEIFVPYEELRSIIKKVATVKSESLSSIIYGKNIYQYTDKLHEDYPEAEAILSRGHKYDVASNAFDRFGIVFSDKQPYDSDNAYIQMLGRQNNTRVFKWIRKDYIRDHISLSKYKVFVSASNGASGTLCDNAARLISVPLIGEPFIGSTETFLTIGSFDTRFEAEALYKYVVSKFARVLLGVLKVTQRNTSETWKYVPLQDFTSTSDIDWTKSIHEIDQQLYNKYGLDETEIDFIESHVKEME